MIAPRSPLNSTRRRLLQWGVSGLVAGSIARPAVAQPAGLAAGDLRYAVEAYGMTVGMLRLASSMDGQKLTAEMTVTADGLAALFSGNRMQYSAQARLEGGVIRPELFLSTQEKSDRQRRIEISYGSDGEITRFDYRNNGRKASSDVPRAAWAGTIDPVTAYLRLRAWMADGTPSLTLPIFDGRKRYDIEARDEGLIQTAIAGRQTIVRAAKLVFFARYGFEPGDMLMTFPGTAASQYARILFRPSDMAPLQMVTVGDSTEATATLVRDCLDPNASMRDCAKP